MSKINKMNEMSESSRSKALGRFKTFTFAAVVAFVPCETVFSQVESADSVLEEVVVIGIRGALQRSLETKRASDGFVDAINSEDIGKLPDQNIAEALQRITGVSISRSRGEGEFVSIRGLGPNFVRGTINGRTLVSTTETYDGIRSGGFSVSTGRETNFDILPAEIISQLQVVKSAAASDVEGGIGGVVNVATHRPISLGHATAVTVKGTHREASDEFDPSGSGLYSWVNDDDTFGVLASVSYSDRNLREDNSDSFGFATFGPAFDGNLDGVADSASISTPFSYIPIVLEESRERVTGQATFEWQPSSTDSVVLDLLHSNRDLENRANSVIVGTCCGFFGGTPGNGVTNDDGSIQVPGLVAQSDVAVGYSYNTSVTNTNTDEQTVDDSFTAVALKYEKVIDDWTVSLDLANSRAKGELDYDSVSTGFTGALPFQYSVVNGQGLHTLLPGGADISDLSLYETRNANAIDRINEDEETSFALNGGRLFSESSFASAVKFGVRYRTRSKDREDRTSFSVNSDVFNLAAANPNSVYTINDFLGNSSPFPFGQFLMFDRDARQQFITARNPDAVFESQFSAPQSYGIVEDTLAAFAQVDIDTTLGSVPVTGNFGVRVVRTEEEVTGFVQPFRIDNDASRENLGTIVTLDPNITEDVTSNKYTNVLPSLNVKFELADDLFLRFAAGQTVTRPTFAQLAPGLSGINPTQRFANSGNPDLKAYESLNLDLGLEWYYGDANAVYGSVFTKDIKEFIGVATAFNVERFGVPFNSISQPLNQGDADIKGVEFGVQHSFDNGFGLIANLTLIDSEAEFTSGDNAGETIPFEGVSDTSYNLTGFYENDAFSARLSYSYRDEFVLLASDVFGNALMTDEYGQLDFGANYHVNDNYSVFFNAINLTDEEVIIFSDMPNQPVSFATVGKRFEIGFKARF